MLIYRIAHMQQGGVQNCEVLIMSGNRLETRKRVVHLFISFGLTSASSVQIKQILYGEIEKKKFTRQRITSKKQAEKYYNYDPYHYTMNRSNMLCNLSNNFINMGPEHGR